MASNTKICKICDLPKALTEFNKCAKKPDGYNIYCRSCINQKKRDDYNSKKKIDPFDVIKTEYLSEINKIIAQMSRGDRELNKELEVKLVEAGEKYDCKLFELTVTSGINFP